MQDREFLELRSDEFPCQAVFGHPYLRDEAVAGGSARATDASGTVQFTVQLSEVESISVQRIGYRPLQSRVTRDGDETFVIVMQPIPRALETVHTIAARETPLSRTGFYDRMDRVHTGAITGEFITPEELERRNANQISDMLRGRRSVTVASVG